MERARKRERRTRIWLALSFVVCLLGCVALMLLQHQEREARGKSAIARIYATNVEQGIHILGPLGVDLARNDPVLLRRTISRTAELLRSEGADFRRIAPEQAAATDRSLTELEQFAATTDPSPAQLASAMTAAARIATTAESVSARQRTLADRATTIRTFGGWGVLGISVLLVGMLIHRDRRLIVAIERARAAELAASAERDTLTGLPTRLKFGLDLELREAVGDELEVVLCDLDEFKEINHRLGHDAGDAVLITVAADLQSAVGDDAVVYRTGGDQFSLLAKPGAGVAARVRATLERDRARSLGSVGTARWPAEGATLREVVRLADQRMYTAKRAIARTSPIQVADIEADAA